MCLSCISLYCKHFLVLPYLVTKLLACLGTTLHTQALMGVVNMATAFQEAQILKIMLAIDFSCQKPLPETPIMLIV